MEHIDLIEVFQDTLDHIAEEDALREAVAHSVSGTVLYKEGETPSLPEPREASAAIEVTQERSFAAAMRLRKAYPEARIAVHNFASATHPGGGVAYGSRAQEECLCRVSTLYPVLTEGRFGMTTTCSTDTAAVPSTRMPASTRRTSAF